MSFWTSQKIHQKHRQLKKGGHYLIHGFDKGNLEPASYELTLSAESEVTGNMISPKIVGKTLKSLSRSALGKSGRLQIKPGHFAILSTVEKVFIPHEVLAFISMKSTIKFKGLINVSGFHVDPGYDGYLRFSVYNAGNKTIILDFNKPTFIIWFSDLAGKEVDSLVYKKKGKTATLLSGELELLQEEPLSPAVLSERIKKLESYKRLSIAIILIIFIPVMLALFDNLIGYILANNSLPSLKSYIQSYTCVCRGK